MYLNWFSRSNLVKSKPRYVGGVKQSPVRRAERHLYSVHGEHEEDKENMRRTKRIWEGPGEHTCGGMSEESATLASVSCKPGASMMQQITVVTSRRMAYLINWNQVITCTIYTQLCVLLLIAYMILLAMEELHMLGQHWQIAQAAEPKQLKS